jgi:hypothetical protein
MQEMQATLEAMELTGESGAGLVKVTMNGNSELRRVTIDPKIIDPRGFLCDIDPRRPEVSLKDRHFGYPHRRGLAGCQLRDAVAQVRDRLLDIGERNAFQLQCAGSNRSRMMRSGLPPTIA